MRYLLLPLTMLLWFIIPYYIIYTIPVIMSLLFPLSWIWIIIIHFAIGVALKLYAHTQMAIGFQLGKLYRYKPIVAYLHIFAGLAGLFYMVGFHIFNPTFIVMDNNYEFFLKGFWEISRLKTVFIALLALSIFSAALWITSFGSLGLWADDSKG
jgi:hypothetical protein